MRFSVLMAVVFGSTASLVFADDPDAIRSEIGDLQRRLSAVESRAVTSDTQTRVSTDALQRSQLLQTQGFTAGYDKGFKVQSADGKFLLQPGLQFQFRSVTNLNDNDDQTVESGFEIRRARVRLDGNAFSKDLRYSFVFDTNRNSGVVSLLDAQIDYKLSSDWGVKFGQFKELWSREKDISGFRQLAVERSLIDAVLAGNLTDRVQGAAINYGYVNKDSPFRSELAIHDGANSRNTDYRDSDGDGNTRIDSNFGVGGRVEYKLAGEWDAYRDFTAKGNKTDLVVIGGGFDFTESGDENIVRATLDGTYENALGFAAFAGAYGVYTEDNDGVDFGALIQASYLLNPSLEIFGRYGLILLDESDQDTFNEFTAGVNYYLGQDGSFGHNAKVTLDVVFLPDGSPSAQSGQGYQSGEDLQIVVRGQFQLTL
jgi:hypothetical protein